MMPDMMLAGVASLIFVAALIAALTTNGERRVSQGHGGADGGSKKKDPTKSKRNVDQTD